MADHATDAAIAAAWPSRWSKANAARPGASKRRNNLRKSWAASQAYAAFKAAHPSALCGNCDNRGVDERLGSFCHLDSDFHGKAVIRDLEAVCIRHAPAPAVEQKEG